MLSDAPWQAALANVFIGTILYASGLIISMLLGIFGWVPLLSVILIVVSFIFLIPLIPILLNLSRSFFLYLFGYIVFHIVITILTYAFHYWHSGLLASNGLQVHAFLDALYFSATTWASSSYGDFVPITSMRMVAACEALTGLLTISISTALLWLWCTENLVDKEKAFWDGDRRHRKSLSVSRMRIRTITGEPKNLGSEWVDPPKSGEAYRWSQDKKEWVLLQEGDKCSEGDLVLEKEQDK